MKQTYILAGFVLLLAALVMPAIAIPITAPIEITEPGTYELTADIKNSGSNAFIVIKADDVVINGDGFLLDGRDLSTSKAIVVERFVKNGEFVYPVNVQINNIRLQDWGTAVSAYLGEIEVNGATFNSNKQGILFKTVHQGAVYASKFTNNYEGIKGLFAQNLVLDGNTFTKNNWGLYLDQSNNIAVTGGTFGTNTYGIRTSATTNLDVTGAKFTANNYGLYLQTTTGDEIAGNTFNNNYYAGYFASGTTAIDFFDNIVQNSKTVGLNLANGVKGNQFWNNKFNNWHNVQFGTNPGLNVWISPGSDLADEPEYGAGPNIINRNVIGGNFWAQPDMMGWSQITSDVHDVYGNVGADKIADSPFQMNQKNVDEFPLHQ